jgi:GNAT superfamily N-acetyltransferase
MPAFRREMEGGAFLADLRDEAYYRYKYLEFGRAFVARDGDRLVGITAATPRRVRFGGVTCDAAEVGDLFVHPAQRGRGLFRAVHDAVLESLAADGVGLVTVRAGRGAADHMKQAFGYRRLFGIAEMVAALTPEGTAGLPFGRVPLLRSLLPRARPGTAGPSVSAVPPADLEPGAAAESGTGVVRDAGRIRSRYVEDPSPYEGIGAGAVLLVSGGKGFVVDQWGDEAARPLADAAIRRLAEAGAHVVHFWRGEREDPFSRALRAAGLRVVRRRKAVLARVLDDALPALPAPDRWTFRMGDTDGI